MTRLLRVELLRLRSRRLIRAVVVLAFAIVALIFFFQFLHAKRSSPELRARFRTERLAQYDEARKEYEDALAQHRVPPDAHRVTREEFAAGLEFFGGHTTYSKEFVFVGEAPDFTRGLGGIAAAVGFLLGATAGGADWSAGTVQALLFWEPRRLRVLAAKVAALLIVVVSVGVLIEVWGLGLGALVASAKGSLTGVGAAFWRTTAGIVARAGAVGGVTATIAFAVAGLTRNTGGALGAGFVYFAIAEQALAALLPRWEPFLLTRNVITWLQGSPLTLGEGSNHEVRLTVLRAGITLLVYAGGLLAVTGVLFQRRDVT